MHPVLSLVADAANVDILGKGLMLGIGVLGPALGIGFIGGNYLQAVGRNPETAKSFGQALVFVAFVELFGLLSFVSLFIVSGK